MSADVERPESQREMDRERAIKRDRAGRVAPDPFVEDAAPFHRLEGDVAEAVVEKVQEHIGKQNEAAGQPKPSRDRWPAPHERRPSRLQGVAYSLFSRLRGVTAKRAHSTILNAIPLPEYACSPRLCGVRRIGVTKDFP